MDWWKEYLILKRLVDNKDSNIMDSDIKFAGAFGSERKEIKIAVYWVNTWYVFVDDYLVSLLTKRDGLWLMTDQGGEGMFTGADAMVLGEIVESAVT